MAIAAVHPLPQTAVVGVAVVVGVVGGVGIACGLLVGAGHLSYLPFDGLIIAESCYEIKYNFVTILLTFWLAGRSRKLVVINLRDNHGNDACDRPNPAVLTEEDQHHADKGYSTTEATEKVAQFIVSHSSQLLSVDHNATDLIGNCVGTFFIVPRTPVPEVAIDHTGDNVGFVGGGEIVNFHSVVHGVTFLSSFCNYYTIDFVTSQHINLLSFYYDFVMLL